MSSLISVFLNITQKVHFTPGPRKKRNQGRNNQFSIDYYAKNEYRIMQKLFPAQIQYFGLWRVFCLGFSFGAFFPHGFWFVCFGFWGF